MLEQQFALDRFSRRSQIPPALLAQMAAQVTKPLALCIANLTHVLDCSTVVLGGEVAELLGDALLDALNARLEELCLAGAGCAVRPARTTASSAWRPISRAWKWMRF